MTFLAKSLLEIVRVSSQLSVDGYYDSIERLGGPDGVFFDHMINGYVITRYEPCVKLIGNDELLGQPDGPDLPATDTRDPTARGKAILARMLFYERNRDNFIRRKRLLMRAVASHEHMRAKLGSLAKETCDAIRKARPGNPIDIYGYLRSFNLASSFAMVSYDAMIPVSVRRDILLAVALLDSKQFSPEFQNRAFASIARLADWICDNFPMQILQEIEIADLTMLVITANESVAYLLFNLLKAGSKYKELPGTTAWSSDGYVEEAIRIDAPIQLVRRRARIDFTVEGKQVRKGESVFFHLGAANRDRQVFREPHRFAMGRPTAAIGFGIGIARCLGAGFATTCAKTFLEEFSRDMSCSWNPERISYLHGLSGRGCLAAEGVIQFH